MLEVDAIAHPIPDQMPFIPRPQRGETRPGAWPLADLVVSETTVAGLPPEAYRLEVSGGRAVVEASDVRGLRHASATLEELADANGGRVPGIRIEDAPALRWRGIIEGFYGEPWSHDERLSALHFAGRVKLNSYVYAPKDDPWHRERWRDLYPPDALARLVELAREGAANGVDVVVALHPAGSMVFADDAEHELLAAKATQLLDAGIPSIALLFDDVPMTPTNDLDRERFGDDGAGIGTAHALTASRFLADVLRPRRADAELLVVATDYAGTRASDYRTAFAAGLPDDTYVWWTGRDIVVGEITRADIDAAGEVFGDRLLLWDNFPVNDFDRGRAFLGPLLGRTGDLDGSALRGAWTNPMVEFAPGCFGMAAFADWAWNPAAYDPQRAARAALRIVAGTDAAALAPLVRTLSSWPPSAPMDPALADAVDAVLAGGDSSDLRARLEELVALGEVDGRREPVRSLRPWLEAASSMGAAGLAALNLAERRGTRADVEAALTRAEQHAAKVATDVVPAFVRTVLEREGS
ncbi:beta-N-acetylglucosaminidase domain-containing protein [Microbacterium sp. HD4P20]|uniref:protein O-GlcNAcase n=1 Tax=Microbacterium sp. HD4P20 TaxID=2864874 RepID=UPI001C63E94C|nr:beta-N-acetylglucosaminidase domain-containing protein [Microbacterium sp. HD4P20]MCP2635544.1 beta-N-acetylglucosaminidase domain-containing protein [Microbacterium sp. HD4P20]